MYTKIIVDTTSNETIISGYICHIFISPNRITIFAVDGWCPFTTMFNNKNALINSM